MTHHIFAESFYGCFFWDWFINELFMGGLPEPGEVPQKSLFLDFPAYLGKDKQVVDQHNSKKYR